MEDLVIAIVLTVAAKFMLFITSIKKSKKKRTRFQPLGVRLFGTWYWWVWANRAPVKHQ